MRTGETYVVFPYWERLGRELMALSLVEECALPRVVRQSRFGAIAAVSVEAFNRALVLFLQMSAPSLPNDSSVTTALRTLLPRCFPPIARSCATCTIPPPFPSSGQPNGPTRS